MGKRHKQSVVKKKEGKDGTKPKQTGSDTKHEATIPKKGPRRQYQGSSVESMRMCDVMMLSQSDGMSEVAWDNETPTCVDQTDIGDLVRRFTTEGSSQGSEEPPSTPPLVSMWMDSPGEEDRSGRKTTLNKTRRRKIRRPVKHPLLKKEVLPSSDILSKLAQVLQSEKTREEKKCLERGSRLLSVDESEEAPCFSTQNVLVSGLPIPLQTADISPILQGTASHRRPPASHLESSSPLETVPKNAVNFCDTPKGALRRGYVNGNAGTPTSTRQNCSSDDLWTDEEFFENDSFLKATQSILECNGSPSPRIAGKRKLTTPVREKKRPTLHQPETSPLSAMLQDSSNQRTCDLFKMPSPIGETRAGKGNPTMGGCFFKVPSSLPPNGGAASVLKETNNLQVKTVSQNKALKPNSITSEKCNTKKNYSLNKQENIPTRSKSHNHGKVVPKYEPKTGNSTRSLNDGKETVSVKPCIASSQILGVQTVNAVVNTVNVTTVHPGVTSKSLTSLKTTLHSNATVVPHSGQLRNKENPLKLKTNIGQVGENVSVKHEACEPICDNKVLKQEVSRETKQNVSRETKQGVSHETSKTSVSCGPLTEQKDVVSGLDLSMSEELLNMLAEPDNLMDSQEPLFTDTVCADQGQPTDQWSERSTLTGQVINIPSDKQTVQRITGDSKVLPGNKLKTRGNLENPPHSYDKDDTVKPLPIQVQKVKDEVHEPLISASQEALFDESGLSDSLLEQSVMNCNSEPLFKDTRSEPSLMNSDSEPLFNDMTCTVSKVKGDVTKTSETSSINSKGAAVTKMKLKQKQQASVVHGKTQTMSYNKSITTTVSGAIPKFQAKMKSLNNTNCVSSAKVPSQVKPPNGLQTSKSVQVKNNKTIPSVPKSYSGPTLHPNPTIFTKNTSAILSSVKVINNLDNKTVAWNQSNGHIKTQSAVLTENQSIKSCNKAPSVLASSVPKTKANIRATVPVHSKATGGRFKFSKTVCSHKPESNAPPPKPAFPQPSFSGSSTETLCSDCVSEGSGETLGEADDIGGENWLEQEELLQLLESPLTPEVKPDVSVEVKNKSTTSSCPGMNGNQPSSKMHAQEITGKNSQSFGKLTTYSGNKTGVSNGRGGLNNASGQRATQNVQQCSDGVKPSTGVKKTPSRLNAAAAEPLQSNMASITTPVNQTQRARSAKTLMKYPSFDSLNTQASPKTVVQSNLSSSQDSKVTPERKCSPQEIERKRQEALRKRQNKLKLAKPKR